MDLSKVKLALLIDDETIRAVELMEIYVVLSETRRLELIKLMKLKRHTRINEFVEDITIKMSSALFVLNEHMLNKIDFSKYE